MIYLTDQEQYHEVIIQFVLFIFLMLWLIWYLSLCVHVMVPWMIPVPDAYYAWYRRWASEGNQKCRHNTCNIKVSILTITSMAMTTSEKPNKW
jgi:hypothetical protein